MSEDDTPEQRRQAALRARRANAPIGVFTTFDPETGEITGRIRGSRKTAEANGPFVEGEFSRKTHVIVDSQPASRDAAEIEGAEIEAAWRELRMGRDARLKDSDWTQIPDAPVDRAAWTKYREALRALPETTTDPRQVVWPAPPSKN